MGGAGRGRSGWRGLLGFIVVGGIPVRLPGGVKGTASTGRAVRGACLSRTEGAGSLETVPAAALCPHTPRGRRGHGVFTSWPSALAGSSVMSEQLPADSGIVGRNAVETLGSASSCFPIHSDSSFFNVYRDIIDM